MGLNSRTIERRVESYLQNIFNAETPFNKKIIQKQKFTLLSKLVTDLFDNKNSRVCFNNISNLIILILNIYNEKFPIDNYSIEDGSSKEEPNSKCKDILKQEFLVE